jgi:hypothetical protein
VKRDQINFKAFASLEDSITKTLKMAHTAFQEIVLAGTSE